MSETPTPAPEAAAPAKPKKLLVVILAVAGLAVGTGGGAFVAAPLLAGKSAAAATPAASAGKKADGGHGEEKPGEQGEAAAPIIYSMENIVLNPAGTSGTRFLMATVAIELADAKHVDKLKERDAEARDLLVSLLGRKTVDELADAARRDSFRAEATAAIAPLLPKKAVKRVFFPQFVIQ